MVLHHDDRNNVRQRVPVSAGHVQGLSQRRLRLAAGVCLLTLISGSSVLLDVSPALAACPHSCGPNERPRDYSVDRGTETLPRRTEVRDLTVGSSRSATLIVEKSADLTSQNAIVGTRAGGIATVEVTGVGSSWTNSSDLTVGLNGGTGKVVISNGASLTTRRLALSTGSWDDGRGGNGTLVVTGAGSTWRNTAGVEIALTSGSHGALTISSGARANIVNEGIRLGAGGSVTVTGAGTRVEIGNPARISNPASLRAVGGVVTVSGGASLYSSNIYIGADGGARATMTVDGLGTEVEAEARFYVGGQYGLSDGGLNGDGSLTVSGGATIKAAVVGVGMDPRSSGAILVTGAGSALKAKANEDLDHDGNFYIGYTGTGVVTIADGGAIEVDGELRIGTNSTGYGTLVIGGNGDTAGTAGTVIADKIVFGAGHGEIVFNHTSLSYEFAAAISGKGILTAQAGTTILTGDSSGFTGTINVTGGILDMQGANGAVAVIDNGAVLKGDGKVGGVDARANSVIAPGNSPGTLTVTGNFSQAAGSIYRVEVSPDGSQGDLVDIAGAATLAPGAILDVVKYGSARYALDVDHTILTADQGVTGTYIVQGDTRISQFYDLVAHYTSNSVSLKSTQTHSFASVASTTNQLAVAGGLQALPTSSDIRGAVGIVQTAEEARSAFDQLSGELHATTRAVILDDSRILRDAIGRQSATQVHSEGPSLWSQGYGSWANLDGDGNAAGFDRNAGGFFFGADGELTDAMRLGFLGGYGHASLGLSEGRGTASIDSYSFGVYGKGTWGSLDLSMGLAQSWHEVSSERNVQFDLFQDELFADYHGRTAQAFAELGYRIESGPVTFKPFAGLAYVNVNTDAFAENGGAAALRASADTTEATYSSIGLRASGHFDVVGVPLAATGVIGWRHNFGDASVSSVHGFDIGNSFTVSSASFDRDTAFVEVGLSAALGSSASLSVAYTGQFGQDVTDSGVRVRFDVNY
ncbi:MAG: autotransporter domain-containing protein [Rhizobium sp.]|nr:autotransporter domain-containing protein [Rhizobium sp.]